MPSAEIITIGTEILLGDILDTNAQYLARALRDAGIDLYRKTTVGDNVQRIAQAIHQSMERCEIVITTGGLGPTVDDPTREAVALAFGVETEYQPELWEQVKQRFRRFNREPTENNRRQAFVPRGAIVIENPVGTAPAFIVERQDRAVIAVPGVPREMEYLVQKAVLPYLRERYQINGVIKTRVVHTAGAGEAQIDDLIGDLEALSNPTVGLAAHSGQVDVRITAKADSDAGANTLIKPIEEVIQSRLGAWIYGFDGDTLEGAAMDALSRRGWTLAVVESGMNGLLIRHLAGVEGPFLGGEMLTELPSPQELMDYTESFRVSRGADAALGISIHPRGEHQEIHLALITPDGTQQLTRPYGGPPEYAARWAFHHSLDVIRSF